MSAALHTLLDHAESQRDAALSALLQAEDQARRLRAQAAQLEAYRDDYRQRHPAQSGRSASIELLRCHQDFMQRLEQALQMQRGQVMQAETRIERLRQQLVEHEIRVASVGKLLQRRAAQALTQTQRLDQRRADEAAAQTLRRHDEAGLGWRMGAEFLPAGH